MHCKNPKYLLKLLMFQHRETGKEIHRLKIHPYAKIEDCIVYVSVRNKHTFHN